jgi:hypothetical protein
MSKFGHGKLMWKKRGNGCRLIFLACPIFHSHKAAQLFDYIDNNMEVFNHDRSYKNGMPDVAQCQVHNIGLAGIAGCLILGMQVSVCRHFAARAFSLIL